MTRFPIPNETAPPARKPHCFPFHGRGPLRVMFVGDSISHGHEGDFTWRYRLWSWFRDQKIPITLLGPWHGTIEPDQPCPPQPPRFMDEPPVYPPLPGYEGRYAKEIDPAFYAEDHHLTRSGWQAMQAKEVIAAQVAEHRPDILLVEMGFNDLAWWVSGPDGLLNSMRLLVDRARSAKPDVQFAVANVCRRTRMEGRDDLPINTDIYNSMLEAAVEGWSQEESRIELVRFRENYSCDLDDTSAAYDGLHPNALGDWQIARAFTQTLVHAFGIGTKEITMPAHIPKRPNPTPSNLTAEVTPGGIVVTWDAVYGAFSYEVRHRRVGSADWLVARVGANRFDTIRCADGDAWEYQVRSDGGGGVTGGWSPWTDTVSAVARPKTAPGPRNVVARATFFGFHISWLPPHGGFEIERYGLLLYDMDAPGSFILDFGIRGTSATVSGLVPGHRYSVGVETWTSDGVGPPTYLPEAIVPKDVPNAACLSEDAFHLATMRLNALKKCPKVTVKEGRPEW